MINLARHDPPAVSDTSSRTTPIGSRRFRRVGSDIESEGFDSVYGESDATYEAYDSDVYVEVHSFLGADSDTDIDLMHAGLNQWSSNDEDEDDDGNTLGSLIARVQLQRSMTSNGQSPEIETAIRVRISERRLVDITNPFGIIDDDQETSPFVGHSGDYLDARSFEELLDRLAEADNSRRDPPPVVLSFVNNLERVVVNNSADYNGLACAICKDLLTVGNVNWLPCLHLYHPSCIKPWLSNRNTCPLCRFEVPTDDVDYENRKQSMTSGLVVQEVEQRVEDTSFEEREGEEVLNVVGGRGRGAGSGLVVQEVEERVEDVSFEEREGEEVLNVDGGRGRGAGRWLYMAAPVVTLVGIGLALWLGNPGAIQGSGSVSSSCGSSQRGTRSRRLWGLL
nr:hypothetical protein [Tanacetum cinerariifolium]